MSGAGAAPVTVEVSIDMNGETYVGTLTKQGGGSQQKNEQKNQQQEGGKRMKKEKKAKGTRKLSPYMKFAQEARPKVLKEHPEMKSDIIGVGRKIGEMWRGLSDAEKAKY